MKVSTDIMRRAEYVKKIVGDQKNKQILDIGTGYGFFVEHMEKQGYKIEGIEIGRARREVAERICFSPIYSYNLVDELPDKMVSRYDIIVLFQVLEHIVSVNTFLKNIYKMMTKDAVLIIEVPNVDDHMLKISSSYNNFFWQKAHVSYFSSETLRKVLIQCGFNNINIHGVQRYSIKNSMNWLLNGKPQLKNPSYIIESELSWIDNYYKNKLSESLKSDTLLATVRI